MPINTKQLIELIIQPTLKEFDLYSPSAEQLLAATCAQESLMGTYLSQVNGPALGIFMMEPATHDDICLNFLKRKVGWPDSNMAINLYPFDCERLPTDFKYATAMCRIHYLRVKEPLPAFNDIDGIWKYYKQYYNTPGGAATQTQFLLNYLKYVKPYYEEK